MKDETYNGWANRATWLVALHLNNDQALQEDALRIAALAYSTAVANVPNFMEDDSPERVNRYAVSMTADAIKDYVEELTNDGTYTTADPGAMLAADLIGTALATVEWAEVAEAFLEDVDRVTDLETANPR